MGSRLAALRTLAAPPNALLVVRAAFVMGLVPALMRLSLPTLAAVLERVPVARRSRGGTQERARAVVNALLRLTAPVVEHRCQLRGITLYYLLRRAGRDVELAFGVADSPQLTEAHCWLTLDGEPYLERRDPRQMFVELYHVPREHGTAVSHHTPHLIAR